MTKKFLYLLCIYLIYVSYTVRADILTEPNIIKINGIPAYENVLNKVLLDVKNEDIKINESTKNIDITIKNTRLMNNIVELYNEAMLDDTNTNTIISKTSKDGRLVVYINKIKGIVTDIIILD